MLSRPPVCWLPTSRSPFDSRAAIAVTRGCETFGAHHMRRPDQVDLRVALWRRGRNGGRLRLGVVLADGDRQVPDASGLPRQLYWRSWGHIWPQGRAGRCTGSVAVPLLVVQAVRVGQRCDGSHADEELAEVGGVPAAVRWPRHDRHDGGRPRVARAPPSPPTSAWPAASTTPSPSPPPGPAGQYARPRPRSSPPSTSYSTTTPTPKSPPSSTSAA